MIQLTQEEVWAFNILEVNAQNAKAELQRAVAARDSFIRLLEGKYDAVFNPNTGQMEPKLEAKKEK